MAVVEAFFVYPKLAIFAYMTNQELKELLSSMKSSGLAFHRFERSYGINSRCIRNLFEKNILTDENKSLIISGLKDICEKTAKIM